MIRLMSGSYDTTQERAYDTTHEPSYDMTHERAYDTTHEPSYDMAHERVPGVPQLFLAWRPEQVDLGLTPEPGPWPRELGPNHHLSLIRTTQQKGLRGGKGWSMDVKAGPA